MAKRVLGNDPFASGDNNSEEPVDEQPKRTTSAPKQPSKRPSKSGPTKRPPVGKAARGSDNSKTPSVAPKENARATSDVVHSGETVPPPPIMPHGVYTPPDDIDDRSSEEESAAPADLPPDLQREPEMRDEQQTRERSSPPGEVRDEIRDLEAELDRLLQQVSERGVGREALDRVAERLRAKMASSVPAPPDTTLPRVGERDEQNVYDVARELLSSDYYRRQWGRVAMRDRSEEVDEFGLDPKYEARCRPFFDFLFEKWWRVETHDIDRVPANGRVILCANHSGALPYDGAMLATALRREHPSHRELRWLAEDFVFHFPFLGVFMNRIGSVRACQENAERLLKKSTCVGVFPEGVKGITKLYRDRYKLQRFGRGGHVKLAIRTRTPIVPVAIMGAEEAFPLIAPTSILGKLFGLPYFPITPTFPLLGPLGLIPVPSKWKMFFLDPIPMDGYAPEAAEDEVLVGRLNEKIRGIIQEELDRAVRQRQSVLKG